MIKENHLKTLLMGDLSVLKNDDISLIDEFIHKFQLVAGKKSLAAEMMFIRACHYNSVNVVNFMLEKELVSGVGMHDHTCLKAALKHDSKEMLISLLKQEKVDERPRDEWLVESCMQGSINCLKVLLDMNEVDDLKTDQIKLLDECSVHLVKNALKKPATKIVEGLILLKEHGATLSGTSQNLLSNAILSHRQNNMIPVVDFLLSNDVSEQSMRSARSALVRLAADSTKSYVNNQQPIGNDHVAHIKALRERIEGYIRERAERGGKSGLPLASLA